MKVIEGDSENGPASLNRRQLFSILPAGVAGCLACHRAVGAALQTQETSGGPSWAEQANMTWEEVFRFAYQKDLIPLLKMMGEKIGRAELVRLIQESGDAVVERKTAGRPPVVPDLTTFAKGMENIPPVIRHALEAEIVERTPEAFEYRVTKCLWAKAFREQEAADIGYAMVCHPDYAVARGLNPKLKLIRNSTIMQGDESCDLRYVMAS